MPFLRFLRVDLDIRTKLAGLTFALLGATVVALSFWLSEHHVESTERALVAKGRVYAKVLQQQTSSAVAFGDRETAREIFEAARFDADIQSLALYGADGTLLGASGESTTRPERSADLVVRRGRKHIDLIAPVVSREGPKGVLVIEMSLASVEADRARTIRASLFAGAAALGIGLVVSWLIGGSIARRLRKIQRATKEVAAGRNAYTPVVDASSDEIGRLASDFNAMAEHIRELVTCMEQNAANEKARLDRLVEERTAELTKRTDDLRFVFDNVGQGFVTLDRSGKLSRERSAILAEWFGPAAGDDITIGDYLGASNAAVGSQLAAGWDMFASDILPFDLAAEQLPTEITVGSQSYRIDYKAVPNRGASSPSGQSDDVSEVILLVSDQTAVVAQRRAERAERELATVFGKIAADPAGIQQFLEEGAAIIRALTTPSVGTSEASLADEKRALHTLKGNAAFFGFERLSSLCHEIETEVVESASLPSPSRRSELGDAWLQSTRRIAPLVGRRRDLVEVERDVLTKLAVDVAAGKPRAELADRVASLMLEPMAQRLARIAEQARSVALSLGKPGLHIVTEDNGLALDAEVWGPFWASFIHVVRNAVDHGIEAPEERVAIAKPTAGTITLRSRRTLTDDIVEVEDDGRGIDWDRLRARATELGVDVSDGDGESGDREHEELLFMDGLSTRTEVTEFSGRGVGLGAVRAACAAMGGRIIVRTTLGTGTCLAFHIPRATGTSSVRLAVA